MTDKLLSLLYAGPVGYYQVLASGVPVWLEQYEHYEKQTYRNRCRIMTANGPEDLSIPVEKFGRQTTVKDIRISGHGDWQQQHWRAITSAYNSSPFLEFYADDIRPFFEKKWDFLWDFNLEFQQVILDLLDVETDIRFTSGYQLTVNQTEDMRMQFHPKKPAEQADYAYYQVFAEKFGFQAEMSILDLLYNMGNESIFVLKKK